jgi:hypothetical protein
MQRSIRSLASMSRMLVPGACRSSSVMNVAKAMPARAIRGFTSTSWKFHGENCKENHDEEKEEMVTGKHLEELLGDFSYFARQPEEEKCVIGARFEFEDFRGKYVIFCSPDHRFLEILYYSSC